MPRRAVATLGASPHVTRASSARASRSSDDLPAVLPSPSPLRAVLNLVTFGMVPLGTPESAPVQGEEVDVASEAGSESNEAGRESAVQSEVDESTNTDEESAETATPAPGARVRSVVEHPSVSSAVVAARLRHSTVEAKASQKKAAAAQAELLEKERKAGLSSSKKAGREALQQADEAVSSSDECLEVIARREQLLEELAGEKPSKSSTFTMGGLKGGSLQAALVATADAAMAKVAESFRKIDMVTLQDFEEAELLDLITDLETVGCKLSNSMYKRIKRAVLAAVQEQAKLMASRRVPLPEKPSSSSELSELLKSTALVGDESRVDMSVAAALPPLAMPKAGEKPAVYAKWKSKPRLTALLSGLSAEERDNVNFVRVVCQQVLLSAGKVIIDDKCSELVAEQLECLLEDVDTGEPGLFLPNDPEAAGVRAHVRMLLKVFAARQAASASDAASTKASDDAQLKKEKALRHLWEVPAGKVDAARALDHTRGRERLQAVVADDKSLSTLYDLYSSIGLKDKANGENSSFAKEFAEASRNYPLLAELLHHQHFPAPSPGALAAFSAHIQGLGGLRGAVGGPVALPVEAVAWAARAVVEVQQFLFKQVARYNLKNKVGEGVDRERMCKAMFHGDFSSNKSSNSSFSMSELTNPADPSQLVDAKASESAMRKMLDELMPIGAAMKAMHPTDMSIQDTLAEVAAACRQESIDGVLTPGTINSTLGAYLREYSAAWAEWQTAAVPMPTAEKAWLEARRGNALETAQRKEMQAKLVEQVKLVASLGKTVKEMSELVKKLQDRVTKCEQATPGREPRVPKLSHAQPPGGPASGGPAPTAAAGDSASMKSLKSDVFWCKKRFEEAEAAATAAAGGADEQAKKAKTAEEKAALAKAEAALKAAKDTQGK